MTHIIASLYILAIVGVIGFQIALIAGAPWGHITQGGRNSGALPTSGRVAAGVSILVLAFMGASVASAAGLPPHWPAWTGWVTLGVQALSALANWITPSRPERRLWGPIVTLMLALAAYVVLTSP